MTTKQIDVAQAVQHGFDNGMYQHYGEVYPFAEWLAARHPRHIAEIGTDTGGTAAMFCEIASGRFISLDLPSQRFGRQVDGEERNRRLGDYYPNFTGIIANSHDPSTVERLREELAGELLDVLFIDADHTLEGVTADYEMYRQFVRPGGVIAFHDVADTEEHRRVGCQVDQLWARLKADPSAGEPHEWIIKNGPWGGIGALVLPEA